MFLLWCETTMRDLVVLKEGGEGMRRSYARAFGKDSHPSDFSRRRLEHGVRDFREIQGPIPLSLAEMETPPGGQRRHRACRDLAKCIGSRECATIQELSLVHTD